MKFIAPLEIASKIMTLIVEAEKELILVSPYVKINDWDKMKKSLSKAVNKGVPITFIVRQETDCDLTPLKTLNITPKLIKGLHAKVYINDKYAIVSSQNLTHSSDTYSIDFGYQTENEKERLELIDFVNNYINEVKAISKIIIHKVETFNYDNIISLKEWQLEKLGTYFFNKYRDIKFVSTFSYIFSGHLLPFADVMISSVYTIKIKKSYPNCEELIDKISEINFDFKHTFKVELKTSHQTFYYLDFIPTHKTNFTDIILDFVNITDSILNSVYVKNISNEKGDKNVKIYH